jgi:hypothetical protein
MPLDLNSRTAESGLGWDRFKLGVGSSHLSSTSEPHQIGKIVRGLTIGSLSRFIIYLLPIEQLAHTLPLLKFGGNSSHVFLIEL